MKWVALVFIVAGISIGGYPFVQDYLSSSQQEQMLQAFSNEKGEASTSHRAQTYAAVNDTLDNGPTTPSTEPDSSFASAILEIPAIDLEVPVVDGTSPSHLENAAGRIRSTAPPGEKGNTAIAAHRSYTEGNLFNRLDKVKSGDKIHVTTKNGVYVYEVEDSFLVLPENTSVLNQPTDSSILTLITCHPMKDPTHRLIVQASLQP
ncbi:class D sortase [Salibacterium salarium]|uniref:Class D sortase n=1 Tax=Salibacterium salarium TaxID=284579 RepID=A0A3R9PZQ5_9BACI|nr:class D sortase [Salibacterium salarium]RSL30481.1 class D sortase [Salibacterium salarium]